MRPARPPSPHLYHEPQQELCQTHSKSCVGPWCEGRCPIPSLAFQSTGAQSESHSVGAPMASKVWKCCFWRFTSAGGTCTSWPPTSCKAHEEGSTRWHPRQTTQGLSVHKPGCLCSSNSLLHVPIILCTHPLARACTWSRMRECLHA